jgi:Fe-S-cluster containining protein
MTVEKSYFLSEALKDALSKKLIEGEQVASMLEHYIEEYKQIASKTNGASAAHSFHKAMDEETEKLKKTKYGKGIKCSAGCSFCCHTHVDINRDEAELLVYKASKIEEKTGKKFIIDLGRLSKQQAKGLEGWNELPYAERKCVFLDEKGQCSVYEWRPATCRAHNAISDPANCDSEKYPNGQIAKGFSLLNEVYSGAIFNATDSGSLPDMVMRVIAENLLKLKPKTLNEATTIKS